VEYNKCKELFNKEKIELKENMYNDFLLYEDELLKWNENINLTAIIKDEEIWIKHFLDSCTISKCINDKANIIDVGTGAGFPGIPLKIINNTIKLTLLDSLNKRVNFLSTICEKLKLKNVNCIHGRAEDFAKENNFREQFDIVTARAVANLATLSEYCIPFIKVDGYFICMKADNVEDELNNAKNAILKLGGEIEKVETFNLADTDIKRTIIIIKKVKNTPNEFPRKAGLPSKQPL